MESYKKNQKNLTKTEKENEVKGVEHMYMKCDEDNMAIRIKISEKKYEYPIDIKMKIKKFPFGEDSPRGGVFGVSGGNIAKWTNWDCHDDNISYCFLTGNLWGKGFFENSEQPYWKAGNGFEEIVLSIKANGKAHYIIDGVDRGEAFTMPFKEFYIFFGLAHEGEAEIC